jgi:hypothetical protein
MDRKLADGFWAQRYAAWAICDTVSCQECGGEDCDMQGNDETASGLNSQERKWSSHWIISFGKDLSFELECVQRRNRVRQFNKSVVQNDYNSFLIYILMSYDHFQSLQNSWLALIAFALRLLKSFPCPPPVFPALQTDYHLWVLSPHSERVRDNKTENETWGEITPRSLRNGVKVIRTWWWLLQIIPSLKYILLSVLWINAQTRSIGDRSEHESKSSEPSCVFVWSLARPCANWGTQAGLVWKIEKFLWSTRQIRLTWWFLRTVYFLSRRGTRLSAPTKAARGDAWCCTFVRPAPSAQRTGLERL